MDVRPLAPTSRAPRASTRPRRPTCVPQRSVIRQQTRWTTVLCLLTGQLSSASLAGAAWPLAALSRHALVRCLPETWTPRIPWGEPERSSAFFVLTSRIPSVLAHFRLPALLSLIFTLSLLTYCTCEAVSLSNVHTLRLGALPLHKGGPAHGYSVADSED